MSLLLEVTSVTKTFADVEVVRQVNFCVRPGERVALVGLNGAGKSTLLRILAGLSEPTKGTIRIDGEEPGTISARALTSFIPDNPILYDDLSLAEHVEYVARLHETDNWREMSDFLVRSFALEDRLEDLPATFSRGLRQKTALVLGFVRPSSLLLIDEPFVGLDRPGRNSLLDLIDGAAEDGTAVIVATHQDDFLGRADRCLGIFDGRLTYDGPMAGAKLDDILAGQE
ncbi:MAG: ABC transporter ATP-binding protein [Acidimicrobiales bacterium]